MISWFRKDLTCIGAALYRGPMAPRPEELDGLAGAGVEVERCSPADGYEWELKLRHPQWGRADVFCPRDVPLPPKELVDWDPRLSKREKEDVSVYGSAVFVRVEPQTHDVLRDRKVLLRFLRAVMGSHGLFAMDHVAQACWSRSALDDELGHDAALDISSLFTIHMVTEGEDDTYWLHSHGLKDLGFSEFDVIEPSESCHQEGYDSLRALAFGIVEGAIAADGAAFDLVNPGGSIQLVSARRFLAQASAGEWKRWRESVDDEHLDGHAIVCDPGGRSWFGFGGKKPQPSRFFSQSFPDEGVIRFSNDASALMSDRARRTYPTFRGLIDELAEFSLPALVKVGYVVDGGGANDKEHLWFEVHSCREHEIEGTLLNQPFGIERLRPGDRGVHPVDLISGWQIFSPFGSITPAFGMALREVRSRPDELRKILADAKAKEA
jgi:hypothetical protein